VSTEIYCRFTINILSYHTTGWLLLEYKEQLFNQLYSFGSLRFLGRILILRGKESIVNHKNINMLSWNWLSYMFQLLIRHHYSIRYKGNFPLYRINWWCLFNRRAETYSLRNFNLIRVYEDWCDWRYSY